jgi:hypothetical protein
MTNAGRDLAEFSTDAENDGSDRVLGLWIDIDVETVNENGLSAVDDLLWRYHSHPRHVRLDELPSSTSSLPYARPFCVASPLFPPHAKLLQSRLWEQKQSHWHRRQVHREPPWAPV